MDEDTVLRVIDAELDVSLGSIYAPPYFAADVLRRARQLPLSYWPEVLDAICVVAFLAVLFVLIVCFASILQHPFWTSLLVAVILVPALGFGVGTLREQND